MPLIDQKQSIFGKIAATKTLTESFPKLSTNNSFPSVNNGGDSLLFLTDIIKAVVGFLALEHVIETTFTNGLKQIEKDIKNALKIELKSIVSCSVNPSIPTYLQSTGSGIKFTVSKVDFSNILKTNPTSDVGLTLYNDITTNFLDSKDFNTFLYGVIQNENTLQAWGHQTGGNDILTFKFVSRDPNNVDPNNTITVNTHINYDKKTLTELNNDLIDTISLFNTENIFTKILDNIFGTVSNQAKKTLSQLEGEEKVHMVIDRITQSESHDKITNQFFDFNSKDLTKISAKALERKNGQQILKTATAFSVGLSMTDIQNASNKISSAVNQTEMKNAISSSITSVSSTIQSQVPNPVDKQTVHANFIQDIINNIIKTLVSTVLSPKVITVFLINFKILYGQNADFNDPIDFIKKNKNLMHNIIKDVSKIIINILLKFALKELSKLIAKATQKRLISKQKDERNQILSLLGLPSETLRLINSFL